VVALGYRKAQIGRFRKLLQEPASFQSECTRLSKTGEALWQEFFEKNKWIFGYGLTYVFLTGLDRASLNGSWSAVMFLAGESVLTPS
jgi:hypothetical protein